MLTYIPSRLLWYGGMELRVTPPQYIIMQDKHPPVITLPHIAAAAVIRCINNTNTAQPPLQHQDNAAPALFSTI